MRYFIISIVPILIGFIVIYGMIKGVKIYECFIEGARDGLKLCFNIYPYLLAMLIAVGVFRGSGALGYFISFIRPIVKFIGLPPEVVPLIMVKPLSGSGAQGVFMDILNQYGADTYIGLVASIIIGSTETIFYTLTVYFGAINIKKIRHTVWAAVMADLTAVIAAVIIAKAIFVK
ncbi:spore maturation protein [Clostridium novyi B str. ATCC 27606]|uniref:Spore maturation protein n=2 Tax=Clostridium TaxID=1485 RepID=A0AA40M1Q2_CLONO|nr:MULTISPECIES: nucleoside recognition domain-containing protein [Clostridium]KEI12691.1 spore maturation protein [Clostridium novyi B str. ATCC 27606]KEI14724.1 spore maturation protein [Clostridium novyi B str. NCTC 9691]KEI15933.1 spore maturation protein [Clostridium haemolyticum NCTC 9693]KGN00284.1 spore maturation protein [Clostridium haemolyticum NCTC 8350]CAG7839194.1 Spore maturation protein B [Clostridium haemolyticum]